MLLGVLSACAPVSPGSKEGVCDSTRPYLNRHLDQIVENGEELLQVDQGSVVETGDELSVAYDAACE